MPTLNFLPSLGMAAAFWLGSRFVLEVAMVGFLLILYIKNVIFSYRFRQGYDSTHLIILQGLLEKALQNFGIIAGKAALPPGNAAKRQGFNLVCANYHLCALI